MMEIVGTSTDHQGTRSDQVSLDVNKFAKSMREELEIFPPFSDQCCIYHVPVQLHVLNEKAYTLRLVSIGPLHHGKEELKAMEGHIIYSKEFVKMILLDGVFIIVIFLKKGYEDPINIVDRIYNKPWMLYDIALDICLIENQLPLFILEDLFKASEIASHYDEECSMIKLTYKFFKDDWNSSLTEGILEEIKASVVAHYVDLVRKSQKPSEPNTPEALESINIPSVTELHQAGVKFKLSPSKSLLDMKFDKGIMEILIYYCISYSPHTHWYTCSVLCCSTVASTISIVSHRLQIALYYLANQC
ncbi:hypothetical protein SADUNF_Sadunf01G0014200 [Salix dunnii]|uniref:Uncharacterized protein n=1 Tax=Salix dunnii TaxID=1413687 RepID=A0A835N9B2_9ROSI|nr:hypothetical protein SADUNF_Sadunf01G0014200 [Salix dunnii]